MSKITLIQRLRANVILTMPQTLH